MTEDFGKRYGSARTRVFDILKDLAWHDRKELETVAGNRYAARVHELRRRGYVVEVRSSTTGEGQAYRLASTTPGAPPAKRVKVYVCEEDAAQLLLGVVSASARDAIGRALRSFRINRDKL